MAGNGGTFRHVPSVRVDKIPITKKKTPVSAAWKFQHKRFSY